MSASIRNLDPSLLWNNFSDLNAVPRASKKEDRVVDFMVAFGEKLGLDTIIDPVKNVIIKKPATVGMENRKTVVLQSHLDMVHQKNEDTNFNFETEGIKMFIDGDWVTAEGTTLGADNGLGVAAIMTILASKEIAHPSLEALFTIDEETGMTGAMGLEGGYLEGDILLNLDTEEDDEIDIGCAGGIDLSAFTNYEEENVLSNFQAFKISVKGLAGGHSGIDIHKGLGNANKIMNQILVSLDKMVKICEIQGGSLRNAIPRESYAIIVTPTEGAASVIKNIEEISKEIKKHFSVIESNLSIEVLPQEGIIRSMNHSSQSKLLSALDESHNGVYKMSKDIPDLVETSNNIAKVLVKDGHIKIDCLTRSSVENSKFELTDKLSNTFSKYGFEVKLSGNYPGWQPNPHSPILKITESLYKDLFDQEPKVVACHAGLECGILGINYPKMDMISFGPTIEGAHSPDERLSISSTQKFWRFLMKILENIPLKDALRNS